MNLVLSYPTWYILLCILLALVGAGLLYWRDSNLGEIARVWKIVLAGFRFCTLLILALLLLEPLLRYSKTQIEKPIVVIAQDNSRSLTLGKDSTYYRNTYPKQLAALEKRLGDKYDVKSYLFGNKLTTGQVPDYSEKETDISEVASSLRDRYANRNLGAVILASDGIYNRGSDPTYAFAGLDAPIYTVALGDSTRQRDLLIHDINHNELAYLHNEFPIEVHIKADLLKGSTSELSVEHNGKVLSRTQVKIDDDNFDTAIPLKLSAEEVGQQHYTVKLSAVNGETTTVNNTRDFYIDVLDSRQKILILARAPHPDIHAIRMALDANMNLQTDVAFIDDFNKKISDYSLVFLDQLPAPGVNINPVIKEIKKNNIPVMEILGAQSDVNQLDELPLGVKFNGNKNTLNDAIPLYNKGFALFTLDNQWLDYAGKLPPLSVPFGDIQASPGIQPLFYQQIGSVSTKMPLVAFNTSRQEKTGIIMGEGLWRWQLSLYAQSGSHELFNQLINNIVQYLSARKDKRYFRVFNKPRYAENEPVILRAELYNQAYELVNDPEVNVNITNEDGASFPFTFSRTGQAYQLNAGMMSPGKYSYVASTTLNDQSFTARGNFSVTKLQLEAVNTVANHHLLGQLATRTGGAEFSPRDLDKLANTIETNSNIKAVSYSSFSLSDLIDLKWIFFLITALLASEWFLRKRNGAY